MVMSEIVERPEENPAISHALELCKAWSTGNYYRFFKLYPRTPDCGRHLVELFLDRERKVALRTLAKACVICRFNGRVV